MMRRGFFALALLLFLPLVSARGDANIASAQQALKDQGFYYGPVTGHKDADTTAALRRYQIRNGLKITGDLNAETERSLGITAGDHGAAPAQTPREPVRPLEEATPAYRGEGAENAPEPDVPEPQNTLRPGAGLFSGTPYEAVPPAVQQRIVVNAQIVLARRGYYREDIDGIFGPGTAFALRAYQAQAGLAVNGRLDAETLAALGLMPGQYSARPHRRIIRSWWPQRPTYRGEWVPY
jgi:peptidoglycan hydrolase-like protein with peptidoglycan-binding domain